MCVYIKTDTLIRKTMKAMWYLRDYAGFAKPQFCLPSRENIGKTSATNRPASVYGNIL
jgi:hypothetical protein